MGPYRPPLSLLFRQPSGRLCPDQVYRQRAATHHSFALCFAARRLPCHCSCLILAWLCESTRIAAAVTLSPVFTSAKAAPRQVSGPGPARRLTTGALGLHRRPLTGRRGRCCARGSCAPGWCRCRPTARGPHPGPQGAPACASPPSRRRCCPRSCRAAGHVRTPPPGRTDHPKHNTWQRTDCKLYKLPRLSDPDHSTVVNAKRQNCPDPNYCFLPRQNAY